MISVGGRVILACVTIAAASVGSLPLEPPAFASEVVRIYVEPLTSRGGDIPLREALVARLRKERTIAVVGSVAEADRVISGFGETFIKGYIGRNHRVRYKNNDARPIYGGYLSVELKDKDDETVWSNLVTPSRLGRQPIAADLSGQLVERLLLFLAKPVGGVKK